MKKCLPPYSYQVEWENLFPEERTTGETVANEDSLNFKLFRCKGMLCDNGVGELVMFNLCSSSRFCSASSVSESRDKSKMLAQGKSPHRHKSRLQDKEGEANAIMNVHLLWVFIKVRVLRAMIRRCSLPSHSGMKRRTYLWKFSIPRGNIYFARSFAPFSSKFYREDNKSEGSEKLTHSIQKYHIIRMFTRC